jgi:hypothetical protein
VLQLVVSNCRRGSMAVLLGQYKRMSKTNFPFGARIKVAE